MARDERGPLYSRNAAQQYLLDHKPNAWGLIDAFGVCMYALHYTAGEHSSKLKELLTWLRSDLGPLDPKRLKLVADSFPSARKAPSADDLREVLPPSLNNALTPLLAVDAAVRDLARALGALEAAVRTLDRQPLSERLRTSHGFLNTSVALLDLLAEHRCAERLKPMELAALAVMCGVEPPVDTRHEAERRAKLWMDRRRDSKGARDALLHLLPELALQAPAGVQQGVPSPPGTAPADAPKPGGGEPS